MSSSIEALRKANQRNRAEAPVRKETSNLVDELANGKNITESAVQEAVTDTERPKTSTSVMDGISIKKKKGIKCKPLSVRMHENVYDALVAFAKENETSVNETLEQILCQVLGIEQ